MSHILTTISKTFAFGSNRMMVQYASALKSEGHDVTVAYEDLPPRVASSKASILEDVKSAGLRTIHVPKLSKSAVSPGGGALAKTVKKLGSDLLISNDLRTAAATMAVAQRLDLPGVAFIQGQPFFQGPAPLRMVKRFVYRRAVSRHATHVICVSPAVAESLANHFGVDPEKCHVVLNGIDHNNLPPINPEARSSVRTEFDVPDDEHLLLTIGRFDRVKGLDILIKAMHQATRQHSLRVRLLIAAEVDSQQSADYRTRLLRLVDRLGLSPRISFLGYRDDCHRLLQGVDSFVLASRSEGFPLAGLEAFAAECPVIMTDFARRFPGFQDRVEGLNVEVGNVDALSNAIVEMASLTEEERREIAKNGRAYFDRHPTVEQSSRAFVEEIQSLLKSPNQTRRRRSHRSAKPSAGSRSPV